MMTDIKQLAINLYKRKSFTDFSLKAPRSFIAKINPRDIKDPLLLQILPRSCELDEVSGFTTDPLGEQKSSPMSGVIHKYPDRVLLLVTNVCAINCRFCFRRV